MCSLEMDGCRATSVRNRCRDRRRRSINTRSVGATDQFKAQTLGYGVQIRHGNTVWNFYPLTFDTVLQHLVQTSQRPIYSFSPSRPILLTAPSYLRLNKTLSLVFCCYQQVCDIFNMSRLWVILQVRGRDGMSTPQNGATAYSQSHISRICQCLPCGFSLPGCPSPTVGPP